MEIPANIKLMDNVVTIIGILYGILLILCAFIKNKVVAAFRLDVLFMSNPTEITAKALNIPVGIFVFIYSVYSLIKWLG